MEWLTKTCVVSGSKHYHTKIFRLYFKGKFTQDNFWSQRCSVFSFPKKKEIHLSVLYCKIFRHYRKLLRTIAQTIADNGTNFCGQWHKLLRAMAQAFVDNTTNFCEQYGNSITIASRDREKRERESNKEHLHYDLYTICGDIIYNILST